MFSPLLSLSLSLSFFLFPSFSLSHLTLPSRSDPSIARLPTLLLPNSPLPSLSFSSEKGLLGIGVSKEERRLGLLPWDSYATIGREGSWT